MTGTNLGEEATNRPCRKAEPRHVGIAFVHGIGSQGAGETLREWAAPLIEAIGERRIQQGGTSDPVIRVETLDRISLIEIEVPVPGGVAHWVLTEAWWAADIAPPAFATRAEWLGPRGALPPIVRMLASTGHAATVSRRARRQLEPYLMGACASPSDEDAVDSGDFRRRLADWAGEAGSVAAALSLQALAALVLVVYGALRTVERLLPIGPLKDQLLTRPIDGFLRDWFGDVFVLLTDPTQAAGAKVRLIEALNRLRKFECQSLVVVAHSGGAIVSYMTLTDQASVNMGSHVNRLVTFGQGLNLARHLSRAGARPDELPRRFGLYRRLSEVHPGLLWNDFWASRDPAPSGPLDVSEVEHPCIESLPIWNRLSVGEDHGSYWGNEEEFLAPLLRRLDGVTLAGSDSRAFPDDPLQDGRSERRRQRLAALSLWRQLGSATPILAIIAGFVVGTGFAEATGTLVGAIAGSLPGHEFVSGPVSAFRDLAAPGQEESLWATRLADLGILVLPAMLALAAVTTLISPPERAAVWSWAAARRLERLAKIAALGLIALAGIRWFLDVTVRDFLARPLLYLAVASAGIVFALLAGSFAAWLGREFIKRVPSSKTVQILLAVAVMSLALVLTAASATAILVRDSLGVMVWGFLAVLAATRVVGGIGGWRWGSWDHRERMDVRNPSPRPAGRESVIVECILLLSTLATLFVVVAGDLRGLLWVPFVLGGSSVLLGVAIDVVSHRASLEPRPPVGSEPLDRGSEVPAMEAGRHKRAAEIELPPIIEHKTETPVEELTQSAAPADGARDSTSEKRGGVTVPGSKWPSELTIGAPTMAADAEESGASSAPESPYVPKPERFGGIRRALRALRHHLPGAGI
jgi:hypothetical protein